MTHHSPLRLEAGSWRDACPGVPAPSMVVAERGGAAEALDACHPPPGPSSPPHASSVGVCTLPRLVDPALNLCSLHPHHTPPLPTWDPMLGKELVGSIPA
jgi:hypothetical protein